MRFLSLTRGGQKERKVPKTLRTDCWEKTHDQEDDDTPEDVHVHLTLQFAAFVAWSIVVQHGFGLMAWKTQH